MTISYDVDAYRNAVVSELVSLIGGGTASERLMPVRLQVREST